MVALLLYIMSQHETEYEILHEIRALTRCEKINHVRLGLQYQLDVATNERFIQMYQMCGMSDEDVDTAISMAADDRYIEANS